MGLGSMGLERTSLWDFFYITLAYYRYQNTLLHITKEQEHVITRIAPCFKEFPHCHLQTGCMFAQLPDGNQDKNNSALPIVVLMISHKYRDEITYTGPTVHPKDHGNIIKV